MTRIDFYYWSSMCPLNIDMLVLLKDYEKQIDIHTYDISNHPELAKKLNLFYPTLTVVNNRRRYFSPLNRHFLETIRNGSLPEETPYRPVLGSAAYSGTILPITAENYHIACRCTGRSHCGGCNHKVSLLSEQGLTVFGFMNVHNGTLLGGAEYMPSVSVPYPIPHDAKKAFLTCVYLSDERYDFKSAPLSALERYLSRRYQSLLVISDEKGIFPNGDLSFFQRHGYTDLGVVANETDYCVLHMLEKELSQPL